VHTDDVGQAVAFALENYDKVSGEKWNVNGAEEKTLSEIGGIIA